MLDHLGIEVGDLDRSKAFYERALEPLGVKLVMEFESMAGFGKETEQGPNPYFWIGLIAAGGTDNGAPACALSTTPATTAPSSSIPTATTSRPSVIAAPNGSQSTESCTARDCCCLRLDGSLRWLREVLMLAKGSWGLCFG